VCQLSLRVVPIRFETTGETMAETHSRSLSPDARVQIDDYLKEWADRMLKVAAGVIGIIVALSGVSIVATARNVSRDVAQEKVSELTGPMRQAQLEAMETVAQAKANGKSLLQEQRQVMAAYIDARSEIDSLKTEAQTLAAGIDQAELLVDAANELSEAHSQIADILLADDRFRDSIAAAVTRKTAKIPTGTIIAFEGSSTEAEKMESVGWFICDGRLVSDSEATVRFKDRKTPVLVGRFPMGAEVAGRMGGLDRTTTSTAGDHSHRRRQVGQPGFGDDNSDNQFLPSNSGDHAHSVDTIPPFYTVVFLIFVR